MPTTKHKTHQATAKRIRKTRTGKLIHRSSGQNHFNGRESGKTTRNKRSDKMLYPSLYRTINSALIS